MAGPATRLCTLCLLAVLAWIVSTAVRAADIAVLCSRSLRAAMIEAAPAFERAGGDRLQVTYGTSHTLKALVEGGTPFDLVVMTPSLITVLVQQGRIAEGSTVTIARTGMGVAVGKGAARPDVSSVEALRRTLLAAWSVAYVTYGASGSAFVAVLRRLGIVGEVRSRGKAVSKGSASEAFARGEADLAAQLMPELMAVPGVDVVGSFPPEVQSYVVLAGGISTDTAHRKRTEAFLNFLKAPAAAAVIRAKGLEPS